MDAHDELFYRLDDPDPRIRDLASVAFLDDAIGRPFLERWATMNDCEEWMASGCGSWTS